MSHLSSLSIDKNYNHENHVTFSYGITRIYERYEHNGLCIILYHTKYELTLRYLIDVYLYYFFLCVVTGFICIVYQKYVHCFINIQSLLL